MLIVLEGGDQAGKATQARMLAASLEQAGVGAVELGFPDYATPIGRRIRSLLRGAPAAAAAAAPAASSSSSRPRPPQVLHLLLAANRWEALPRIRRALESGRAVVLDRYYHSNLVYGMAAGLDRRWLEGLDAGLPRPDLVIVLDMDPAESSRRKAAGRDRFESDAGLLGRVRSLYLDEARRARPRWKVVDAAGPREEVHARVIGAAGPAVRRKLGAALAPSLRQRPRRPLTRRPRPSGSARKT